MRGDAPRACGSGGAASGDFADIPKWPAKIVPGRRAGLALIDQQVSAIFICPGQGIVESRLDGVIAQVSNDTECGVLFAQRINGGGVIQRSQASSQQGRIRPAKLIVSREVLNLAQTVDHRDIVGISRPCRPLCVR